MKVQIMPIKVLVNNLKDTKDFMTNTNRFSMAHEIETAIEYLDEQALRIKELEKAVRVLASEPHETVINRVYGAMFPKEIEAQERDCKN